MLQFVILVVDSTDRERLSITKEELHKMMGHDELSRANILVFANKQVRIGEGNIPNYLQLSLMMSFNNPNYSNMSTNYILGC